MGNACLRVKTQTVGIRPSSHRQRNELTSQEIHSIKTHWTDFVSRGRVNGGIYYFVDLLQKHPDAGIHFGLPLNPSKQDCTYQALKHNLKLRRHVGKMFRKLSEAVDNIEDLSPINPNLAAVGEKHTLYGININYIRDGWPHLRYALTMHLNMCLSPKGERYWSNFYDIVMDQIIGAFPRIKEKYRYEWDIYNTVDNDKQESIY